MVKDGKDSLWALASEFPRLRCQISELNSAISIYQKQGCWPCALHLLQLTNAMEIATLVSYNAGMAGSPWKMAAVMLKQLKMKGFKSDIISYNSNLSAVAGKNSWCRALQFFKELCRNRLSPTVVTSSAMISGCEESWQLALSFAKLAPSNIISQNALLSAMAKGQQWRGALNLFEEVCFSKSLKYTVATFNALMSAYAKSSQWQGALCTLKEMRFRDVQADLITLNSVLDACSRSGEWQVAVQLLCDFEAQGLQVDEVSMSAVVSACEEVKEWQAAVSLLYSAVQRSCADRMTCNAAISACGLASKWQHSLTILDFMISLAMQVSIVTYNSTISACEKSEFWYEDVITCNAMLGSCAQRLEWRRALNAIVAKDNDGLGNGGTNVCKCQHWISTSAELETSQTGPYRFRVSVWLRDPSHAMATRPNHDTAATREESPMTLWVLSLNRSVLADFENGISDGFGTEAEASGSHGDDHSLGKCQPCVFRHSSNGCPVLRCCYCHQDHPPIVLKQRVRKRTRDKIKDKLREIVHSEQTLDEIQHQLQKEALRHPFAQLLIASFLKDPVNFVW
eukprot:symbB.v1.2.029151.t1/scaffold3149.1/size62434/4